MTTPVTVVTVNPSFSTKKLSHAPIQYPKKPIVKPPPYSVTNPFGRFSGRMNQPEIKSVILQGFQSLVESILAYAPEEIFNLPIEPLVESTVQNLTSLKEPLTKLQARLQTSFQTQANKGEPFPRELVKVIIQINEFVSLLEKLVEKIPVKQPEISENFEAGQKPLTEKGMEETPLSPVEEFQKNFPVFIRNLEKTLSFLPQTLPPQIKEALVSYLEQPVIQAFLQPKEIPVQQKGPVIQNPYLAAQATAQHLMPFVQEAVQRTMPRVIKKELILQVYPYYVPKIVGALPKNIRGVPQETVAPSKNELNISIKNPVIPSPVKSETNLIPPPILTKEMPKTPSEELPVKIPLTIPLPPSAPAPSSLLPPIPLPTSVPLPPPPLPSAKLPPPPVIPAQVPSENIKKKEPLLIEPLKDSTGFPPVAHALKKELVLPVPPMPIKTDMAFPFIAPYSVYEREVPSRGGIYEKELPIIQGPAVMNQVDHMRMVPPFSTEIPFAFIVPYMPSFPIVAAPFVSSSKAKKPVQDVEPEDVEDGFGEKDVQLLAYIPEGETWYGDAFGEGASDEKPLRILPLKKFAIGVYLVTNAQFITYLNHKSKNGKISLEKNGYVFSSEGDLLCQIRGGNIASDIEAERHKRFLGFKVKEGRESYPITCVTYFGAKDFCKEGGFRLPTEMEWEKAAGVKIDERNKVVQKFRFGCSKDVIDHSLASFEFTETTPVGFYNGYTTSIQDGHTFRTSNAESPFGCYDMSGNVWEWTETESGENRIVKGGSFQSSASELRVSSRKAKESSSLDEMTGFRVAIS